MSKNEGNQKDEGEAHDRSDILEKEIGSKHSKDEKAHSVGEEDLHEEINKLKKDQNDKRPEIEVEFVK